MFITIEQIKAARALLKWNQKELAAHAGLHDDQVHSFESGRTRSLEVLEAIQKAFADEGIEFMTGGVRKRVAQIKAYDGVEGFRAFMDDVYETVKEHGGMICVHNVAPNNWIKWLGREWNAFHTSRMQKIDKKFDFRITIKENDNNLIGKHAEYRWLPERSWNDQSFYAYGDKLALMLFEEEDVNIRVIHNQQFADGFRSLFCLAWDHIPPISSNSSRSSK